jgi:hypothetical protein
MKRDISIDREEAQLLEDTLNYIVNDSDSEKEDFIEQLKDDGITDETPFFDEHDNLIIKEVPKKHRNHIFYKASLLLQALAGPMYGG